jgi:cbb3-type cytochrome oxidase cytochrome c subunit
MAASAYIHEAANQVRNAIGALEADISTIQHDAYSREAHLKNEAEHEEIEAEEFRLRAASAYEQEAQEKAYEARRAKLELEAKEKMKEVERQSAEAARVVQAKTALINSLRGLVSQLDRLAASAGS